MSSLTPYLHNFCYGGEETDRIVANQPFVSPRLDFAGCIDMVVAIKGKFTEPAERPGTVRWDKFMAHLSFGKDQNVYPLEDAANKSPLEALEHKVDYAQRRLGLTDLQIFISIVDRESFARSKEEISMSIRRCQRAVHQIEEALMMCNRIGGRLTVFSHPARVSSIMFRSAGESLYHDGLDTELHGSDKIPLKEYRDLISELELFEICMSLASS